MQAISTLRPDPKRFARWKDHGSSKPPPKAKTVPGPPPTKAVTAPAKAKAPPLPVPLHQPLKVSPPMPPEEPDRIRLAIGLPFRQSVGQCILQGGIPHRLVSSARSSEITVGIDEAGRGAVDGDMVYGLLAVESCNQQQLHEQGHRDSKELSPEDRASLASRVRSVARSKEATLPDGHPAVAWMTCSATAQHIDSFLLQRREKSPQADLRSIPPPLHHQTVPPCLLTRRAAPNRRTGSASD